MTVKVEGLANSNSSWGGDKKSDAWIAQVIKTNEAM